MCYTEPNLVPPFLDDLALSHDSASCRISSGHRNGKLAQTSQFGKCNEIDLTMAACIFMDSPHIPFKFKHICSLCLKYMHMLEYLFGSKQNHFHHNYFLKAEARVTQKSISQIMHTE